MGDVLSQNEIDNLLSALNSGEFDPMEIDNEDERQIKEYDFARPSKFSKEHLRTLVFIFEHYARLLSTNLPVYLRKSVQVEVMHSEAATYQEFSNSLSDPVLLGVVNFAPLEGNIIMEMATGLGYAIVDRMLGGDGQPLEKNREFTAHHYRAHHCSLRQPVSGAVAECSAIGAAAGEDRDQFTVCPVCHAE